MHIFTYGSLMFDPVWSRVVQGKYGSLHATLEGYRRLRIRGDSYPALWPDAPDRQVNGVLYLAVSAADLERLDRFEGPEYDRRPLAVLTAEGPVVAEVYLFRDQYARRLSSREWEPEWFAANGIHSFLNRYRGFM